MLAIWSTFDLSARKYILYRIVSYRMTSINGQHRSIRCRWRSTASVKTLLKCSNCSLGRPVIRPPTRLSFRQSFRQPAVSHAPGQTNLPTWHVDRQIIKYTCYMAVYNYCLLLELSGGLRSVSILCLHASLSYNCILTVVKYTDISPRYLTSDGLPGQCVWEA